MATLPEMFHALFVGLQRAHGEYSVPDDAVPDAKGKLEGKARTVHTPLTAEVWARHLKGAQSFGLGVTPILEDATCLWGAIDVDVYPLDLPKLEALARSKGLPLVLCRTKSGGAHLYLFMASPAPAEIVRAKLMEWAVALGFPGVEVFPKQTSLASERDYGNWINMPYQGGARTTRYALSPEGQALSPTEFLDLVSTRLITEEDLRAFELPPDENIGDFLDGAPPCLQTLAAGGVGNWRNNFIFSVAVYLRKRFGNGWGEELAAYNERLVDPPLSASDLAQVVKSVGKKSYGYKCKDEPICGVCNKAVCLTREFGVGGSNDDPGVVFGPMVMLMTDPPTFIWDVDGARIEVDAEVLMNQTLFHKVVINKLRKWPTLVKGPAWQRIVRERLEVAEQVEVPKDATKEGQLGVHLQAFCTGRSRARAVDELLMGKPFADAERGRTFFRSSDFLAYLQQHRVANVSERSLYQWLKREGMEHHFFNLKGKGVNCWSVVSFEEQKVEHDVPRVPSEEM